MKIKSIYVSVAFKSARIIFPLGYAANAINFLSRFLRTTSILAIYQEKGKIYTTVASVVSLRSNGEKVVELTADVVTIFLSITIGRKPLVGLGHLPRSWIHYFSSRTLWTAS